MKSPSCLINKKQTTSFRMVGSMLTIASLWLMLATANTAAHAQTSNPSPADWTQFHRDNMQRWNPYETVLGVGNASSLKSKWVNPIDSYGGSSLAVVNGVVYLGSDDGNVYALNASTGAKLWSYTTGAVGSSPAVANGVVYVSSGGGVYALNASTGAKLWSYTTVGGTASSPAVANGVVYVGSNDNNVYALDAATGAKLWSFQTGGLISYSSPAVANGAVYVGSSDYNVYALNASTGALIWKYATEYFVDSSPAVANGVVYIGSEDKNVYALNASTGAKLWSYTTGGDISSSPAVANGVVYIGSTDGNMYALNARTGAKLWSYDAGGFVASSPAVANGVVYVGSYAYNVNALNASMYALNASTGDKLWTYNTGLDLPVVIDPAVVDGVVYFRTGHPFTVKGNVYAFALRVTDADLFLRIQPSTTTVHQGDLITYAFPVWNLGPDNADYEVLNTQVPEGTTLDYVRISGTPGLGTCTTPAYGGTGEIVCHENSAMAPNTTWTVRVVVRVTAPAGTIITENATVTEDTPDPNPANNTATVSMTVQ
jgi:outer membrane protein assembly factor BamB